MLQYAELIESEMAVAPRGRDRVLIAENDDVYRKYLGMVYTGAGFDVVEVGSCGDLLSKIAEQEFDLVVCSYAMPDGLVDLAVSKLKEDQQTSALPIIILLPTADVHTCESVLNNGADEVVVKPVRRNELVARSRALLRFIRNLEDKNRADYKALTRRLNDRLEERRENLEEQIKSGLYREMIFSFTQGRLILLSAVDFDTYINSSLNFKFTSSFVLKNAFSISQARIVAENECDKINLDEDVKDDLLLVVSEAATNTIKHGGGGEMDVGYSEVDDAMYLLFRDTGNGISESFLANALFFAGASAKKSFGYGFKIILDIIDSIVMTTGPSGTGILMRKNRLPAPAVDALDEILKRF